MGWAHSHSLDVNLIVDILDQLLTDFIKCANFDIAVNNRLENGRREMFSTFEAEFLGAVAT